METSVQWLLGTLAAIAAIAMPFIVRRQRKRRILVWTTLMEEIKTGIRFLREPDGEAAGIDMHLVAGDRRLDAPHCFVMAFSNEGNEAIEQDHFENHADGRGVRVEFPGAEVICYQVDTSDGGPTVLVKQIRDDCVLIECLLLNPGENCSVSIVLEGCPERVIVGVRVNADVRPKPGHDSVGSAVRGTLDGPLPRRPSGGMLGPLKRFFGRAVPTGLRGGHGRPAGSVG